MLTKVITYKNFDGNEVTDTLYFNMSEADLAELEASYKGGMEAAINALIAAEDGQSIIREFKRIIGWAYGIKSEDGRRFIKSPELSEEFFQTNAWPALFMELLTGDGDNMVNFVAGFVPADLAQKAKLIVKNPEQVPDTVPQETTDALTKLREDAATSSNRPAMTDEEFNRFEEWRRLRDSGN